jgi:hypothetical protein
MESVLGPFKECSKPQCKGTLVKVLARYENRGRLCTEFECHKCGKVQRDEATLDYLRELKERRKLK